MDHPESTLEPIALDHRGDESHLLREVYRTHQALIGTVSRAVGISASRLTLLRILAVEPPKQAGIMELARRLGINAAAVTRLVQEMEEQGWLKRHADPGDGRRSHVGLTAKGMRQFRRIHERMHEFERAINASLAPGEAVTAVKVLSEVRQALEQLK